MIFNRLKKTILSVYLYNEQQGYTQLETLAQVFHAKYPDDLEMFKAIKNHAADEKKHYQMFLNYFAKTNTTAVSVSSRFSYIDELVSKLFGFKIAALDKTQVVENETQLFKLFRAIMITEERGLKQVQWLLRQEFILNDSFLKHIFTVVAADEPSHFMPYKNWLEKRGAELVGWRERLADLWVHYSLVIFKVPLLFILSA